MAFFIGLFPTIFYGRITPDSRVVVERLRAAETRADESLAARPASGGQSLKAVELAALLGSRGEGGAK
jgi:hypothetical protein